MVRCLTASVLALLLAGCAGLSGVDSTVESFARWDATPSGAPAAPAATVPDGPQRFRFERLPSQTDGSGGQARLEALARTVLASRGWTATDADARWTVQLSATSVRSARDPWNDPWGPWRLRGHVVAGNGHVYFAPVFAFPPDPPDQQRQVTLLIREAATGRVVYETRAEHVSRWNNTPALWQAMLEAALRDFPKPPAGPRQVQVDLPS